MSLVKSDVLNEGVKLEVVVCWLKASIIKWSILTDLLDYGELIGLGQWRSGGYGRFQWNEA